MPDESDVDEEIDVMKLTEADRDPDLRGTEGHDHHGGLPGR